MHPLDTIPRNLYVELKAHRGTAQCEEKTQNFKAMFNFTTKYEKLDHTVEVMKKNIFSS